MSFLSISHIDNKWFCIQYKLASHLQLRGRGSSVKDTVLSARQKYHLWMHKAFQKLGSSISIKYDIFLTLSTFETTNVTILLYLLM